MRIPKDQQCEIRGCILPAKAAQPHGVSDGKGGFVPEDVFVCLDAHDLTIGLDSTLLPERILNRLTQ